MSGHANAAVAALGLQLDELLLEGEVNSGYADALEAAEARDALAVVASCRVIAASCLALAAPLRARAAFHAAARTYHQLALPYALILSVCARDGEGMRAFQRTGSEELPSPDLELGRFLFTSWIRARFERHSSERSIGLRQEADRRIGSHWHVGRLGLPLGLYERALNHPNDSAGGLGVLLERAADEVRLAQADDYNWRELRSGLLPVEPELLAACLIALEWYQSETVTPETLRSQLNEQGLSELGAAPLLVAMRMSDISSE
jgi:hypothetical protein